MVNGKTNAPSVPLTTFPLLSLLTDVSSATSHPFLCSRPSPTPSPSHSEAGTGLKLIQHKPFFSLFLCFCTRIQASWNRKSVSFSVSAAHTRSLGGHPNLIKYFSLAGPRSSQSTVISEIRQVKTNRQSRHSHHCLRSEITTGKIIPMLLVLWILSRGLSTFFSTKKFKKVLLNLNGSFLALLC